MVRAMLAASLAIFSLPGLAQAQTPEEAAKQFDSIIAPLLVRRCLDCHTGAKPKAGLILGTRAGMLKGGKTGAAVTPGKLQDSLLWEHVQSGHMPPKKALPDTEKALVKDWIARGAPWGTDPIDPFRFTSETRAGYDWWSLRSVVRPALPAVTNKAWPGNPIDHFVLARLEAKKLAPQPLADRRTLIRRVTFDLIGLPPTPEVIDAFVKDKRPDAYNQLVERLLASPHYGERWARHWLDVVRFGESNGFEHDELRPNAWPYRDWVIRAFNEDLPYDEFARRQLAGDVLRPPDPGSIVATGFLVANGFDSVGQQQQSAAMRAVVRQDELEDMVGAVGQTFLGLTVNCARCHDHKFDPVRQEEYYRLAAALAGVRHGQRPLPSQVVSKENERKQARLNELAADLKSQLQALPATALTQVYACVPNTPEATHLLIRGEPAQKGPLVAPGGVAALIGVKADFGLAPDASDADRRRALAAWITDSKNPLFPRVMARRLLRAMNRRQMSRRRRVGETDCKFRSVGNSAWPGPRPRKWPSLKPRSTSRSDFPSLEFGLRLDQSPAHNGGVKSFDP